MASRENPFRTAGFTLAEWQREAVKRWSAGDSLGVHRGTLEIFTGGGKTLIALSCIERTSKRFPDLRVAIVVPTEALARQWRRALERWTHLTGDSIGMLGAGSHDGFNGRRVLVCVLNTASHVLPAMAETAQPLMLVVDECHRAGAPSFSRVLRARAVATLGLSATPEREAVDEQGEPLTYDQQVVGRSLGSIVYRFTLKDAQQAGWLPTYTIHHHGIALSEAEVRDYDSLSRRVDDAADRMRDLGINASRAQTLAGRDDEVGRAVQAWVGATASRKDVLYRASERQRVTIMLVDQLLERSTSPRILLFHERVDEAVKLHEQLVAEHPSLTFALEHSKLSLAPRLGAMEAFRSGKAVALVSVKSLVEGLDVPEADVGISVASSSSVRQRIQSLGRVLRRRFDKPELEKSAEMHILYVAGTVDELIYAKEDWSDLTGDGANRYFLWSLGAAQPVEQSGPPREPALTEEQEWARLGEQSPVAPTPWRGVLPAIEYSVDTRGNVTNASGSLISNPQGVDEMVTSVRGRPGGRFRVTSAHRLVIVFGEGQDGPVPFVAGQLAEAFLVDSPRKPAQVDGSQTEPGEVYQGPPTREFGSFRVRSKRGGEIERRVGSRALEFALRDDAEDQRHKNARCVLESWRKVSDRGFQFHVNELWDAWYLEGGRPRFLANVPGGFAWPSEEASGG